MPYATPGAATTAQEIGKGRAKNPGLGRLGLGLGLNAADRGAFRTAADTGQLDTFLADKGLDRRFEKALDRPGARGARATAFQGVNAAAPPPASAVPPPVSAAANGKASAPPPAPAAPGAAATAAPTFAQRLAQMYGEGNPFGAQAWYGENPLETASAVANRELGKNLAGIRERYGASGLGNSDRLALAEGTAMGEATTGLGDVLASRGIDARSGDLGRLMQGLLGGEQLAQGREQMPIQALDALNRAGFGLMDMQGLEQMTPLLQMILPMLAGFAPTTTSGDAWSRTRTT